jgi:AcrR family transcriptional regulator
MVGRRERKKTELRAALRDAAFQLFAEQGFAATRISDITDAVDVSERTFFRYFDSKEEIAVASLRAWVERLITAIEAVPEDRRPLDAVGVVLERARAGGFPFGAEELRDVVAFVMYPEVQVHFARVNEIVRLRMIDDFARRSGRPVTDPYPRVMASVTSAGLFAIMEAWLLAGGGADAWDLALAAIAEVAADFGATGFAP